MASDDHKACQAAHQALYDAAVEIMESPPPLGTQREYFDHRLGTLGHHYTIKGIEEIVAERDRLQAAVDEAHGAMDGSAYVGGLGEREAWQTATRALGLVVTQHIASAEAE